MFMPKVSFRMAAASPVRVGIRRTDQLGAHNSSVQPHRGPVDHHTDQMLRTERRPPTYRRGRDEPAATAVTLRCCRYPMRWKSHSAEGRRTRTEPARGLAFGPPAGSVTCRTSCSSGECLGLEAVELGLGDRSGVE